MPPQKPEHTVTITPATAAAIARMVAEYQLDRENLSLLVSLGARGQFKLDLSEDPAEIASPDNALAISHGVAIVVPRGSVQDLADTVINFEHGAFRFHGPSIPTSQASDPGRVELSREKYFALVPELRHDNDAFERTAHYLREGDSRAAVVWSIQPRIVVAAYTDELDAVALLAFDAALLARYKIKPGTKLLTINSYVSGEGTAPDLVRGPRAYDRFCNFTPHIAEFLTDDLNRVSERKREIAPQEWERTVALARQAIPRAKGRYRDGRPPYSEHPA